MAFIDVILLILLAYGAIRGVWNGFFSEAASLLSLILGIYIAIKFSIFMRDFLLKHVSWNPGTIRIGAFILTFVLVVIGITLLAKFLSALAGALGLGIVNKLLGGFLGVIKMILIISIVLNLFEKLNSGEALADKDSMEKSILYHPIRKTAALVYPSLEKWFGELKKSTSAP